MASLSEWQSQTAFPPNVRGKINTRIGRQITLRLRETVNAFAVYLVDCQKEIIRMLNPAKKKPQKYHRLLSAVNVINSLSSGLKIEKNCLENRTIKR